MKKFTKLMMLASAMCWAANVMAQDWTFYYPDNIKHQGTQTDHTIVVKDRTAPTLADFNNDGKLEMVYGGQNDGDWDWYYQEKEIDGEKQWTWDWGWNYNWNNSAYVIGFNGWDADPVRLDGKTDYWTLETDTYGIPLGTHNFYRWIDFDNDGNLDLIMFAKKDYDNHGLADGQDYYALIYRNGGAEAGYKFSKVDKAPFNIVEGVAGFNPNNGCFDGNDRCGRNNRGITFGDVNSDGIVDFVCMNYGEQLSVFLGNGDGSFTKKVQLEDAYREGNVKLADLDGDGVLDIVATGWNGRGSNAAHTNFYKGLGNGTFENKTPENVKSVRGGDIAVADFNNDGLVDLAITGYSDLDGGWPSCSYMNKGNFEFECIDNGMIPTDGCVVYAFDADNDGNTDIFMNWGDTQLFLQLGKGDGTFSNGKWCNNWQSGDKSGGGFSFGDVYGRNMLDQAICYKKSDNAHIGIIPGRAGSDGNGELNQAPTAPTNVKALRDGTKVTVTWDAATDEKTPQASLIYNVYVKYGDVVRCLVPAIIETGKLKVVQDMQTLPMGTTYTLNIPANATNLEIGVQAIDGVFAPSAFAKAEILEPTYTVAGAPAGVGGGEENSLFGTTWDPTLTDNDMVKGDDGIYRLEKKGYLLEAGDYEFKVVANHNWDVAYPEQNATFNVAESGTYNVTFTFNEETKEVNVTVLMPFSVSFTTNAEWEEVYAYVWTGEGENKVLGDWPGTKMTYNKRYSQYELSFEAAVTPDKIIFNNGNSGKGNQTEDLDFINQNAYLYLVEPTPKDVYTVAGAFNGSAEVDPIFGTQWDVENTDNDMVKGDDGIYTLTRSNVELFDSGNILYKVVKNHSWDVNWGFPEKENGNAEYILNLPEGAASAIYNFTFKFNPEATFDNGYYVDCVVETESVTTGILTVNGVAANRAVVYNMAGQKVMKTQKGLYIVNGKKIVIK